jgi:hypothetical protein
VSIAAVLGVKDEVELVAASIAHLRRIGVEQIIVSDYGSTDGTLDVLEAQRRVGDVSVMHVNPAAITDYSTWSARELALAKRTGADWVVFLDADEFWIPASGWLRECRDLTEADVLVVERFNVPLTSKRLLMPVDLAPANYGDLLLFTRRPDDFRAYVEAHPEVPFITVMPGPKVMARPWAIGALAPGHHGIDANGAHVRRIATDLLIAHVPFSTASRFARKLENIRAEIVQHSAYFSGDLAWHWRRWAEMTEPGEVEQEFARQVVDDRTLGLLRRAGSVRSAAEVFAHPVHVDRVRRETLVADLERLKQELALRDDRLNELQRFRELLQRENAEAAARIDALTDNVAARDRRLEGLRAELEVRRTAGRIVLIRLRETLDTFEDSPTPGREDLQQAHVCGDAGPNGSLSTDSSELPRLDAAVGQVIDLLGRARRERDSAMAERDSVVAARVEILRQRDEVMHRLNHELELMRRSKSWRVTSPLRSIRRGTGGVLQRVTSRLKRLLRAGLRIQ